MDISVTNDCGSMYKVAKYSNDEGAIKLFAYNIEGKGSDKYARFFLITPDGVFIQDDDFGTFPTSLREAFEDISSDPELSYNFFKPSIVALCSTLDGFDMSVLD